MFAIESFMDEMAAAAGADPVEFRLRHMKDPRARAVIELAAQKAGWQANAASDGTSGRGFAYSQYKNGYGHLAVVIELGLEPDLHVRRVVAAVDVGQAINPDGVINQTEGGIVQAISWTLKEQVKFDRERVATRSWEDYPILTFPEVPEVEVHLINRPDEAPLGAGEIAAGPVPRGHRQRAIPRAWRARARSAAHARTHHRGAEHNFATRRRPMKVKTNGIEINYEIAGSGPWVTLSHSLACNLHMWDEQMDALTEKIQGAPVRHARPRREQRAADVEYTLEQMADDVHGLFASLGIKQTHWVGLSMGGMIGETLRAQVPGRVQKPGARRHHQPPPAAAPTRCGATASKSRVEKGMDALVDSTLERWFTAPYRSSRKDVMARIADNIRATPVAGFAGCSLAISKIDLLDRLKEIKCPTFIIVGEEDHGTPPEMARAIHQNLPGSELLIIPSAAHISNIEQHEVFTSALMRFLK